MKLWTLCGKHGMDKLWRDETFAFPKANGGTPKHYSLNFLRLPEEEGSAETKLNINASFSFSCAPETILKTKWQSILPQAFKQDYKKNLTLRLSKPRACFLTLPSTHMTDGGQGLYLPVGMEYNSIQKFYLSLTFWEEPPSHPTVKHAFS